MNESLIKVIKPQSKFRLPRFNWPKKPVVLIAITLFLAIASVVTAWILYQRRAEPVAPTAPKKVPAATTTIISDNFDGVSLDTIKWTVVTAATGSKVIQAGGQLTSIIPQQTAQGYTALQYSDQINGDFSAEVDLVSTSGVDTSGVEFFFSNLTGVGAQGPMARVSRIKTVSGERLDTEFGSGTGYSSIDLPANTGPVRVKIVRVGNVLQTFYNSGSGFVLLGSAIGGYAGDGTLELVSVVSAPNFPANTAVWDNFSAKVNLTEIGIEPSCTVTFNVLALVPTPTPTPTSSPTPSPTPSPTATPTPSATPTPTPTITPSPTPTPVAFGPTPTPTPTPVTFAPTPTPTPVTLTEAGSVAGTWTISIAGILLLGLGSLLMLAF